MKVYEALAQAAAREGIESVFAVMGDANKLWLATLPSVSPSVRVHYTRHESTAVAMADGFARATGKLAACSVTAGPGLAFTATSLITARRHGSPLLLYSGDLAIGDRIGVQYIDQRRFVETLEVEHRALLRPASVVEDFSLACAFARTRRTPVVVSVPTDVQESVYPGERVTNVAIPSARPRSIPDPAVVDTIVELLQSAERPLILAGRGAFGAGTRELLEEAAELLDAPLCTTLLAKGLFDDHPLHLGVVGLFSNPTMHEVLDSVDVVLAVGASLNHYTTENGTLLGAAKVIQIDVQPYLPRPGYRVPEHHLQADARVGLTEIVQRLRGQRAPGAAERRAEIDRGIAAAHAAEPPVVAAGTMIDGKLDPRGVMPVLADAMRGDEQFVIGMGHFWWFPIQYLRFQPGHAIFTHDFGSIGQALPVGIGAAIARPEQRVVVIEGDASILMSVQELDTAARYGVRVIVIVLNDEGVGAEYHRLISKGVEPRDSIIPSPDLATVAEGFGALGLRGRTQAELEESLQRAQAHQGPALIDVRISREHLAEPYRRLWYPKETVAAASRAGSRAD